MAQFLAHKIEEHADAIGNYFFDGKLANAKQINGSNLRKLFYGLAGQNSYVDQIFEEAWKNTNILTTDNIDYIRLWEAAVGIPDNVFIDTESLSIDDRKNQVLLKLRGLGTLTEQDYIDLAALFGVAISITHPIDNLYPPYNVPFTPFGSAKQARFTMIITGNGLATDNFPPYSVPFTPTKLYSEVRELFDIIKPANVKHIYYNS